MGTVLVPLLLSAKAFAGFITGAIKLVQDRMFQGHERRRGMFLSHARSMRAALSTTVNCTWVSPLMVN